MTSNIKMHPRDRDRIQSIVHRTVGSDIFVRDQSERMANANRERRIGYMVSAATVVAVYLMITTGIYHAKTGLSFSFAMWFVAWGGFTYGLCKLSRSPKQSQELCTERINLFGPIGWAEKVFVRLSTMSALYVHLSLLVPAAAWMMQGTAADVVIGFSIFVFVLAFLPAIITGNGD